MANEQHVRELIKKARQEGWTDLDLSHKRLTTLPADIGNLPTLITLDLSGNDLDSLPPEICRLSELVDLSLVQNQLTSLPLRMADLTKLESLDLSQNRLKSFPQVISALLNLRGLYLSGNQLSHLPDYIGRLTDLRNFYISANQLTWLPSEIAKLTKLTDLDISRNLLRNLPPEISDLSSLTILTAEYNHLTSLPSHITKLTNLTYLDLKGNPLNIPPESLANARGVKAIFAAITGLASGERLNEAKMLVVGDGKVGKSSVVERLTHGTFSPKKTTLGIEISDEVKIVESKVKGEHSDVIKLNIWDFGGQEIQHSTHQFFLTTRSLYLLVVDARKGEQLSNIEYWLKLIESFGADSPVIVVVNQIDQLEGQRPLNLDRKALQNKYNIKAFVETSCASGQGIDVLKEAIGREVEQLKHVRDLWPREWVAIKQRLREMQADYIPVEKYLEICREENLSDEDLQQSLLDILHVLGTVVRFPGDTEVLNPRWVTQGVYGLLTSEQLVEDRGQFDLKNVGQILDSIPDAKERYPPHTHSRLIDVMRHFELCFEFTDRRGHYLIPRHLHDDEVDVLWDDSDGLKFQYHYETLPDSVISRFIVRMSQYITKQYYWKNGVFLHSGENRAKIKADSLDRKIFISIIGKEKTRRAFLAVIRSAFDEINSNFTIDIKQFIPVMNDPKVLVSYQDLLAYEEMGEAEIVIPQLRKKLSVRELLEGIENLSVDLEGDGGDVRSRQALSHLQAREQTRVLRVIVASPGDVQSERDELPSVIDEVNRSVAADRGLHLELGRWETDAYPGFHVEGPQALIDETLQITDCDLLIGIFWKRFGTPTADGKTGTEHELYLAYEAWKKKRSPQILVYFNQKASTPKSKAEAEQWGQVLEFKDKFPKEGLWWPYKGKSQFEKLVRRHLTNYIRNLDLH